MRVYLATERLTLREFTEGDVDNLFELDSDPEVMRFLTGGKPTPRDVIADERLPMYLRYHAESPAFGFWAAIEKPTGHFLGWFELRPREPSGDEEVELGYRLRRSAWGKGYATEGARALIEKAFAELGARRVVAFTMAVNLASRRVMEKAGLSHVRTFHETWADPIDGSDKGEVEYAIRREEWENKRAGRGDLDPREPGAHS